MENGIKESGIKKSYTRRFLLDEAKLRKLTDVLKQHLTKLEEEHNLLFHVRREDDSYYSTYDIEGILSDDNVPGKAITSLIIEVEKTKSTENMGQDPDASQSSVAFVAFRLHSEEKIVYSIQEKSRDWCFLLSDELDSQVARILKKGIPSFMQSRAVDGFVAVLVTAIIFTWVTFKLTDLPIPVLIDGINEMTIDERTKLILQMIIENRNNKEVIWILPVFLLPMFLFMGAAALRPLSRLMVKMNRPCFYWGDMVKINDRLEKTASRVKWAFYILFPMSIAATVLGGILIK
ncbi:MAG: hypothetical protein JRC92_10235 [Deltaproteobacteria bacterium]|nr:hypothetical protein [Deltaproteobacteria bacterium]